MPTTIDFTALTGPLPEGQQPQLVVIPRMPSRLAVLSSVAGLFLGVLTTFGGIGGVAGVMRNASAGLTAESNAVAPAAIALVGVAILITSIYRLQRAAKGPTHESMAARLEAFADENHLLYSDASADPVYPGAIFTLPQMVDRRARRHIRSSTGRFFDFGEFEARMDLDGSTPIMRRWGFIAISLDRRLPHMMLKSRLDNRHSLALPDDLFENQTLSLEGDFDTWFTLYAPEQYERDALYVFTPDLMALFIDEAAPFDAEIIDDWLFVYSNVPFTSLGAEAYERVFRIIELVGAKTAKQTAHYADERVDDRSSNTVAAPGRRLRRNVPLTLLRAVLLLLVLAAVVVGVFYGISLLPGVKN